MIFFLLKSFGFKKSPDTYGKFREWNEKDIYTRIAPRNAHGSDWSSIIIGNESTANKGQ